MSIEAPAGKNPIDHAGKLYAELCARIAVAAVDVSGRPTTATIATGRGRPLDDPQAVFVEVGTAVLELEVEELIRRTATIEVENVARLPGEFLAGGWLSTSS
jgi:S-adenosylmethionine synthetase